jgi:hypothetical protein
MSETGTNADTESRARLARAQTAYDAGDFAAVHGLCASLSGTPGAAELAARARELSARVAIDSASWIALATCLALLLAIVVVYVG